MSFDVCRNVYDRSGRSLRLQGPQRQGALVQEGRHTRHTRPTLRRLVARLHIRLIRLTTHNNNNNHNNHKARLHTRQVHRAPIVQQEVRLFGEKK